MTINSEDTSGTLSQPHRFFPIHGRRDDIPSSPFIEETLKSDLPSLVEVSHHTPKASTSGQVNAAQFGSETDSNAKIVSTVASSGMAVTALNSTFQTGTIKMSNEQLVYILTDLIIPGSSNNCITVSWIQILKELLGKEKLCLDLVKSLKAQPGMRTKIIRALARDQSGHSSSSSGDFSDFSLAPSLGLSTGFEEPLFPSGGNQSDTQTDSPFMPRYATSAQQRQPQTSPMTSSAGDSPLSPSNRSSLGFTPAQMESLALSNISLGQINVNSLPPMPTPAPEVLSPTAIPMLGQTYPKTLVAASDTIDSMILRERPCNHEDMTYVWSYEDSTLYPADTPQGMQALEDSNSIKMIFPRGTMLMAREKDGSLASPAYTPGNPNSNEWLKAQVCNHRCPYREGTQSLKRPKTIREHFQKCLYIGENHPLKVLSALLLRVLERESQGFLPNRRHARGAMRPGPTSTVGGIATHARASPYPPVYTGNNGASRTSSTSSLQSFSLASGSAQSQTHFLGISSIPTFPIGIDVGTAPGLTCSSSNAEPSILRQSSGMSFNTHSQTFTSPAMPATHRGAFNLSADEDSPLTSSELDSPDFIMPVSH